MATNTHFPIVRVLAEDLGTAGDPRYGIVLVVFFSKSFLVYRSIFIAERNGHVVVPMGEFKGVYYYTLDDLQLLIFESKALGGWPIETPLYDNTSQGGSAA